MAKWVRSVSAAPLMCILCNKSWPSAADDNNNEYVTSNTPDLLWLHHQGNVSEKRCSAFCEHLFVQRKQTRNAATQATLKKMFNDFLMIFFDAIRECVHGMNCTRWCSCIKLLFFCLMRFCMHAEILHRTCEKNSNVKQNTGGKIISNLRRNLSRNLCECKLPWIVWNCNINRIFLASYAVTTCLLLIYSIRLRIHYHYYFLFFFVDIADVSSVSHTLCV